MSNSTVSYVVLQDGRPYYNDHEDLNVAIEHAEVLLGGSEEAATFSVTDRDGRLLASVTNRTINGNFVSQELGGRKGDDAIYVAEEEFEATVQVLLLSHDELVELEDRSESTDAIGRSCIDWSGPCEVKMTDSICEYFGVKDLESITPEALAFARNRANPTPPTEEFITLSIKVKVKVQAGVDVQDFIDNLDYSVRSQTVGINVIDTEIVDSDHQESSVVSGKPPSPRG